MVSPAEETPIALVLSQIPALEPPPGETPNFIDPTSRAQLARIVISVTLPLMLLFLAARTYTRVKIFHALGADDYLCIVAAASVVAYSGVTLTLLGHPLGPHQWDVPLSQFNAEFLKGTLTSICLYAISSLFVKSALLVLYLRIFRPVERATKMIWAGIIIIVLFYVITIVLNIIDCVPIDRTTPVPDAEEWEAKLKESHCSQPVYNLSAAQGVFSVISDFYVLLIPMSLVLKVRLPLSRKFGIASIFLTGLLACALSATSTVFRFKQLNSYDFTWDSIPIYTLRAAELNIGIICSCLPVVFVLLKRVIHSDHFGFLRRRITPGLQRGTQSPSNPVTSQMNEYRFANGIPRGELPVRPRPVATHLRSFVRSIHSSNPRHTSQASNYAEIASIDNGSSTEPRRG